MHASTAGPRNLRSFFIIWLGQLASLIGSGLTSFALGVWIFERTQQATPFALTVLAANLPRVLLLPVAGALADRWNRRTLMIVADTGNAVVTLGTLALLWGGQLQIWHIYLIALANAVFGAFQEPAYLASVSLLVPKQDLGRAGGLMQLGQSLEIILSPVLAGLLFVVVGLNGIILIDFATFLVAVGALLAVRIPQPPAAPAAGAAARPSMVGDMAEGWRYLRARPGLFGLLLYFALANFSLNLAGVLTGPLVLATSPASVLGTVQMAAGVGMLLGSIVMSAWRGPQRRVLALIGGITSGAAGLVLAGAQGSPWFVGAGLFVLMVSIPVASASSQAIFQTKVAPALQGRVFAMRGLVSRSMMPVAFILAGPLADRLAEPLMAPGGALAQTVLGSLLGTGPGRGIGLVFVLAGLLLAAASAVALATPHIRHVETDLPDAVPDSAVEAEAEAPAPAASVAAA